ncbi:HAD family hydrolase [Polaribacter sp.]|jgi:phosphoglycolate phosphatase-like HAD superfamily hydrolase|uniref:HAD family hydrolase n=1 Tax=Polaribacter sp. TaxID=1920175 RepID=UPI003EEF389D
MQKIKNIFFDFDGVIAESVSAKTDAFREMYAPYGEVIANEVVEYHIKHGGVSRFEKFKYWEKKFFNKDISEDRVDELAKQFSNLVLNKVIVSDEVPGVNAFIKKYSKELNFWIITGTPTSEIEIIVDKRGLINYFLGIHGSPKNKRYWTEYLLKKHHLKREETLFIGDATTDLDAATFSNLHFALRENEENKEIFKNYEGNRFKDFFEFEESFKNNI